MSRRQVPFIAFYRKEYVEPELNINDLWKVWHWDEKVGHDTAVLAGGLRDVRPGGLTLTNISPSVDPAEDPEAEPETPLPQDAGLPV